MTLFDGLGTEAIGRLVFSGSGSVHVEIETIHYFERKGPYSIVGLAIPDNRDALSKAIRSVVQLGVDRISLLTTCYCGLRKSTNVMRYMDRWRKAIIAAGKQCGRRWLPDLTGPEDLQEFFTTIPEDIDVYIGGEPGLTGLQWESVGRPDELSGFAWIVGPEGGWSREDCRVMNRWNPHYIQLGNLTLTSEVAAITGLAVLKTLLGIWPRYDDHVRVDQ